MSFGITALFSGQYFSEERGERSEKAGVKVTVVDPDGMGHVLSDPCRIILVGKILPENQETVRFRDASHNIEARHSVPDVIKHVDQHHQIEAPIGKRTILNRMCVDHDCSPGMLGLKPSSGEPKIVERQGIAANHRADEPSPADQSDIGVRTAP